MSKGEEGEVGVAVDAGEGKVCMLHLLNECESEIKDECDVQSHCI